MDSLIGIKVGMSRMFDDAGNSVPVTVLNMSGNRVCQVKQASSADGYDAVQLAVGEAKKKRTSNAQVGHLAKYKAGLARTLYEVRVSPEVAAAAEAGSAARLDAFAEGTVVDVAGISKGRGFTGAIRRHNFRSGRASHGNSRAHNKPGSSGQCQDPGRVFKGKKMAGHLGNKGVTVRNLRITRIDIERQLIYVSGGVPGSINSEVMLHKAAALHQIQEGK